VYQRWTTNQKKEFTCIKDGLQTKELDQPSKSSGIIAVVLFTM